MTQDEIIEMAAEIWNAGSSFPIPSSDDVLRFAKLVAEAEREALKQIIRETPFSNWFQADLIEAIDKRGQALAQPKQDGDCKKCKDGCPACDARKIPNDLL